MTTRAIVIALQDTGDFDPTDGNGPFALVNGRPAVSYAVENLKACELVSDVVLVVDESRFDVAPDADVFVAARENEAESILSGVRTANGAARCLIMSGGMPLASPRALTDLLAHAPDSDVVYPIIEQSDIEAAFPGRDSHYVRTREGHFTGSSTLLFRPEVASTREDVIRDLLNARRNPAALLGLVGAGMVMKLMFGKPGLSEFEQALSNSAGLGCRAFVSRFPGLFISIDSSDDIALAERALSAWQD